MPCKICGKNACTESFHSFMEQDEFQAKKLNRIINVLEKELPWLREDLLELAQKIYDILYP